MGAEIEIVSGVVVPLKPDGIRPFLRLADGSMNNAFTTRRNFPSRMRSTNSSVTIFTGKLQGLKDKSRYLTHSQAIRDS